jgi:site-specific recombinase XerD
MKKNLQIIEGHQAGSISLMVQTVCTGLTHNTKLSYARESLRFLDWLAIEKKPLTLLSTCAYKQKLLDDGKSPSAINLALAAIRFFVRQAAKLDYLTSERAEKIASVESVKTRGTRLGVWLSKAQLETLISAPHTSRFAGSLLPFRDQAILATLGGAGLRRSEVANLKVEQIVSRESRWILADIEGKGGVVRSIPIAAWIKTALDRWLSLALITKGFVFCQCPWAVRLDAPYSAVSNVSLLTNETIRNVVKRYAMKSLGFAISSHDLRRSFAKLARKNGCPLEQIQFSLGHFSINTTQLYTGGETDLVNSPSDYLRLQIKTPGEYYSVNPCTDAVNVCHV